LLSSATQEVRRLIALARPWAVDCVKYIAGEQKVDARGLSEK